MFHIYVRIPQGSIHKSGRRWLMGTVDASRCITDMAARKRSRIVKMACNKKIQLQWFSGSSYDCHPRLHQKLILRHGHCLGSIPVSGRYLAWSKTGVVIADLLGAELHLQRYTQGAMLVDSSKERDLRWQMPRIWWWKHPLQWAKDYIYIYTVCLRIVLPVFSIRTSPWVDSKNLPKLPAFSVSIVSASLSERFAQK